MRQRWRRSWKNNFPYRLSMFVWKISWKIIGDYSIRNIDKGKYSENVPRICTRNTVSLNKGNSTTSGAEAKSSVRDYSLISIGCNVSVRIMLHHQRASTPRQDFRRHWDSSTLPWLTIERLKIEFITANSNDQRFWFIMTFCIQTIRFIGTFCSSSTHRRASTSESIMVRVIIANSND